MNKLNNQEQVVLIGIGELRPDSITEYYWVEFTELAKAAGAIEIGRVIQSRDKPDPAFFIGSGKARLLAELVREKGVDLVISIQELSPVQVRNLEEITGVRVIDRTDLILDIFAGRAHTKEGKLQVELAQLNYILPRLGGRTQFSRLGGGIGTRGPGETKLEIDKRRIKRRITDLRRQLMEVEKHRSIQRHLREKNQIATVSLIGYTNAGKSTLFNRMTGSEVPARNRLFDTLDPVSRRIRLPGGREVIILDTVGFVSNLPHQLVAAFKATLEETVRSKLLLHVMDASVPYLGQHFAAVQNVLQELKINTKDMINVLNKVDLVQNNNLIQHLVKEWSGIPISAKNGTGIAELLVELDRRQDLSAKGSSC
jgi:GTPase